ncbi:MAG: hypothetical protein JNK64_18265 [Myxococcales bacterium]|nr:hypothetical protein [Myxococcales bacterium]
MGRRIDTSPPKVCAYGLAIAITALAPSAARADDADRAPVIAIDLVSDAAVAAGVFNVAHTAPAGMVGYALGAPIVHAAYGKWARAGQSFGVRLAVPLVGAAIGCGLHSGQRGEHDEEESCWPRALAGVAAGMVVAQIIDAAYLSRASDEPTPRMLSIGGAF